MLQVSPPLKHHHFGSPPSPVQRGRSSGRRKDEGLGSTAWIAAVATAAPSGRREEGKGILVSSLFAFLPRRFSC